MYTYVYCETDRQTEKQSSESTSGYLLPYQFAYVQHTLGKWTFGSMWITAPIFTNSRFEYKHNRMRNTNPVVLATNQSIAW